MAAPALPLAELRRIEWRGLIVVIETEAGQVREWTRPDGSIGKTRIDLPYGYIDGVEGSDGDELDCYVGRDPEAKFVYVVHQLTPAGKRDEDKCFLDVATAGAAESFFLQHRDDGDAAYGGMSAIPVEAFLAKLKRRTGTGKIRHGRMGTTMPVRSFHGIAGADLRGFAGRVQAFDALDAAGGVRVGVWDRFATFGEGDQGLKVKEGEAVAFNHETFTKMVDNWAARGQQLTMCLDHRSALGGIVEAPAAALYDAIAVVGEDGQTLHMKSVYGKTIAAPDAATLIEQCAKYPPPLSQPGGMWGYRAEITPKGQHPTEGLANFRGISPLFVMNGVDEQERPIGPVLFDVAAVNVNFQGGCELTLGALTRLARMSAAESALHDAAPIGEKPEDKVTTMAAEVTAKCPDCGREVKVNDGRYAVHTTGEGGVTCSESNRKVSTKFGATAIAIDCGGQELRAGDKVRALPGQGLLTDVVGVVDRINGESVYVTFPGGAWWSGEAKKLIKTFAATVMSTTADLSVGDRLKNAKTGNAGTITEKKPDGSVHVKWEGADGDGWFYPGAPLPPEISKMSATLGASAMSDLGSEKLCPICSRPMDLKGASTWPPHDRYFNSLKEVVTNQHIPCPWSGRQAFSATPGAARRFNSQGAPMDPSLMTRMGFADGANPSIEEKMSKFAAYAMGDASAEDCKSMAEDLDKHEEPAAKAMAVKLRKMAAVEPHAEPDGDELHKMAEAADLKPVGMSRSAIFAGVRERLVTMRATTVPREDVKGLKEEIATLKARNAAADEAECEGAIVAFARTAIADGRWDPDGEEALVALARASVDASKSGKAKAEVGTKAAERHLKQKGFWKVMSNFTANGHPVGKGNQSEDFTSGHASASAAEVEYKAEIVKVMETDKVSHGVAMSRVAKAKPQLIAALRK